MSQPTQHPRGEPSDGKAPAPIAFDLQGGCPGHYSAVQGRTAAMCLTCARLPIGGEQMAPAWRSEAGQAECDKWVGHGVTVRALGADGHPAGVGGPRTSENTALWENT
jgi:hypothetical protein